MHVPNDSASGSPSAALLTDELLDELDDVIVRMTRMMSSRHQHVGPDCCPETLTLSQAMLLRALDAHDGSKMSDVAVLLAVKPPAASAAVAQLERDGYVRREIDPDDRRVTLVHVTEEGKCALNTAEEHRRSGMRKVLAVLEVSDIEELIRIHHTLISAMDDGRV